MSVGYQIQLRRDGSFLHHVVEAVNKAPRTDLRGSHFGISSSGKAFFFIVHQQLLVWSAEKKSSDYLNFQLPSSGLPYTSDLILLLDDRQNEHATWPTIVAISAAGQLRVRTSGRQRDYAVDLRGEVMLELRLLRHEGDVLDLLATTTSGSIFSIKLDKHLSRYVWLESQLLGSLKPSSGLASRLLRGFLGSGSHDEPTEVVRAVAFSLDDRDHLVGVMRNMLTSFDLAGGTPIATDQNLLSRLLPRFWNCYPPIEKRAVTEAIWQAGAQASFVDAVHGDGKRDLLVLVKASNGAVLNGQTAWAIARIPDVSNLSQCDWFAPLRLNPEIDASPSDVRLMLPHRVPHDRLRRPFDALFLFTQDRVYALGFPSTVGNVVYLPFDSHFEFPARDSCLGTVSSPQSGEVFVFSRESTVQRLFLLPRKLSELELSSRQLVVDIDACSSSLSSTSANRIRESLSAFADGHLASSWTLAQSVYADRTSNEDFVADVLHVVQVLLKAGEGDSDESLSRKTSLVELVLQFLEVVELKTPLHNTECSVLWSNGGTVRRLRFPLVLAETMERLHACAAMQRALRPAICASLSKNLQYAIDGAISSGRLADPFSVDGVMETLIRAIVERLLTGNGVLVTAELLGDVLVTAQLVTEFAQSITDSRAKTRGELARDEERDNLWTAQRGLVQAVTSLCELLARLLSNARIPSDTKTDIRNTLGYIAAWLLQQPTPPPPQVGHSLIVDIFNAGEYRLALTLAEGIADIKNLIRMTMVEDLAEQSRRFERYRVTFPNFQKILCDYYLSHGLYMRLLEESGDDADAACRGIPAIQWQRTLQGGDIASATDDLLKLTEKTTDNIDERDVFAALCLLGAATSTNTYKKARLFLRLGALQRDTPPRLIERVYPGNGSRALTAQEVFDVNMMDEDPGTSASSLMRCLNLTCWLRDSGSGDVADEACRTVWRKAVASNTVFHDLLRLLRDADCANPLDVDDDHIRVDSFAVLSGAETIAVDAIHARSIAAIREEIERSREASARRSNGSKTKRSVNSSADGGHNVFDPRLLQKLCGEYSV